MLIHFFFLFIQSILSCSFIRQISLMGNYESVPQFSALQKGSGGVVIEIVALFLSGKGVSADYKETMCQNKRIPIKWVFNRLSWSFSCGRNELFYRAQFSPSTWGARGIHILICEAFFIPKATMQIFRIDVGTTKETFPSVGLKAP